MDRRSLVGKCFGLIPASYADVKKTWTVMPLDDSITAGGKLFHSYRGPLARMLERAGFALR